MTRRLLVCLAATLLVPAATADAAPTCRSGDTLERAGGVRFFVVHQSERLYACRPGSRRPVFLAYHSTTYSSLSVGARKGALLPFRQMHSSEGGGCETEVGWFDTKTGRRGVGDAFGSQRCMLLEDVAVAQDGTTAVVSHPDEEAEDSTVVSLHARDGSRRLQDGRGRAFVRGGYVSGSLRLTATAITWRDATGARSVPRAGEPLTCSAGRTRVAVGTVRVLEAFDPPRSTTVLRWCSDTATTPQSLPQQRTFEGFGGAPRLSPEAGGRVAFAFDGLAGVADATTGTVRARKTPAFRPYDAVAVGPGGELVAAYDPPNGLPEGGVFVVAPGVTPTAFAGPRLLTTVREDLTPGSFAVADGAVSFATKEGSRRVPLTGEAADSCTAGTTIGRRDGVRLFEVVDLPTQTRALLGCFDGAAPITLQRGPAANGFRAFLFGVRSGRAVLVRTAAKNADPDTLTTFGPEPGSVRSGQAPGDARYVAYRDVAIGPDGALAFLLDAERMEAYLMTPTADGLATARKLGAKGGGYRAKSLAVTATAVTWTTKAGATVSVPRPSS